LALAHQLFDIPIGGGNNAGVRVDGFIAPQPLEGLFFDGP